MPPASYIVNETPHHDFHEIQTVDALVKLTDPGGRGPSPVPTEPDSPLQKDTRLLHGPSQSLGGSGKPGAQASVLSDAVGILVLTRRISILILSVVETWHMFVIRAACPFTPFEAAEIPLKLQSLTQGQLLLVVPKLLAQPIILVTEREDFTVQVHNLPM